MKNKYPILKSLLAIFLALAPTIVFAWDIYGDLGFKISELLKNDLSIGFLIKIFGYVPGVDQFPLGDRTIVGTVFYAFNLGVLALSGVFLIYNITKVLTETTMDGAAMGKSATMWATVRCSLGISLLVPNVSGYSVINGIVMWVVVQSIGLANLTWNMAVDHLKSGAPTFTGSMTSFDTSLISYVFDTKDITKVNNIGSADVLVSLACSYLVRDALAQAQLNVRNTLQGRKNKGESLSSKEEEILSKTSKSIGERDTYFKIKHDVKGSFIFPYVEAEAAKEYGLYKDGDPNKLMKNDVKSLSEKCGKITYNAGKFADSKKTGLEHMIGELEKTARNMVTKVKSADKSNNLNPLTYVVLDGVGKTETMLRDSQQMPTFSKIARQDWGVLKLPFDAEPMVTAASLYKIALAAGDAAIVDQSNNKIIKALEEAKSQGWIGAGGYYRILAKADSEAKILDSDKRLESSEKRDKDFFVVADKIKEALKKVSEELSPSYEGYLDTIISWIGASSGYADILARRVANDLSTQATGGTASKKNLAMPNIGLFKTYSRAAIIAQIAIVAVLFITPLTALPALPLIIPLPLNILYYNINDIMTCWFENMDDVNNENLDPILKLQRVGDKMINVSFNSMSLVSGLLGGVYASIMIGNLAMMWVNVGISAAASANFWGLGTGINVSMQSLNNMYGDLGTMMQTLLNMHMPILISIMGPVLVCGIILSVYIPVIPYLLFLFGAISWIISILILMAAAPIICFLMLWGSASQENPLLSREAEQFVMQIVGVFFRPTLMIIGLVAGMMLSYVGVDILNIGFSNMFDIILGDDSSKIDASPLAAIKVAGAIIIYTFTMISIVNMCFSTIHLVYSEVMRVAGVSAPAVGMEEKQAEAVKGGVTQFSEAGSSGAKESSGSFKNAGKSKFKYKKGEPKDDAGGEDDEEEEEDEEKETSDQ